MTKKKNKRKIYIPIFTIIILIAIILFAVCNKEDDNKNNNYQDSKVTNNDKNNSDIPRNDKYEPLDDSLTPEQNLVKDYLKNNLSTLSPKKEVLGGKFYLTNIEFLEDKQAKISYEDGHNLFTAIIEYKLSYKEDLFISKFTIIDNNEELRATEETSN